MFEENIINELLLTTCSVNGARLGSLDLKQLTADGTQESYIWL